MSVEQYLELGMEFLCQRGTEFIVGEDCCMISIVFHFLLLRKLDDVENLVSCANAFHR